MPGASGQIHKDDLKTAKSGFTWAVMVMEPFSMFYD